MALELYFSNQLEPLAEILSERIEAENRLHKNLFQAPMVIAPNANLVKWLQLTVAGKQSILLNVDFRYLENGLWDILTALDRDEPKPELLSGAHYRMLMLHVLKDLDRNDPDLQPVSAYLYDRSEKRPDFVKRNWQLADKLAHLFQEYEFHRTEMLRQWIAGSSFSDDKMEICQRKMYRDLHALKEKYRERTGNRAFSLMEYADYLFSSGQKRFVKTDGSTPIHIFGMSQISTFHLGLLGRLQSVYPINIYTMNPSREYWEDIRSPREKRWIRRKGVPGLSIQLSEAEQGELFRKEDNALLAAWGKPGRENIRLLCELTDYEFYTCYTAEKPQTGILQRIQNDILTLKETGGDRQVQDRSLQVFGCPEITREIETVYNNILFNMTADSSLMLTDIAILVPDISEYKPTIDAVFNRRERLLAYNLVDSNAEIESLYGNAVLGLLALAGGRFTRKAVFDLLLNPCVMNRWKISRNEILVWAQWAAELGIFHSFDELDRQARGYTPDKCYTWKQGQQRLRMGRLFSPPDDDEAIGSSQFQGLVPYADLNTGDHELMEKFCAVVEAFHEMVALLKNRSTSGKKWKELLILVSDRLIAIPPDSRGEAIVRSKLIDCLDSLQFYDHLVQDPSQSVITLEMMREFISSSLGAISGGHGDYLTGGVTISALQPMRPIPFRIVYILGMQEGRFPGRADMSSLDLRIRKRRIGDSTAPERNSYLFLEVLLSVREKLYIGFLSRDLQRDQKYQPCSVVNQLCRYAEKEILPPGKAFAVTEIPLKGSSKRYQEADTVSNCSDVLVNYDVSDWVIRMRSAGLWDEFLQQAERPQVEQTRFMTPTFDMPEEGQGLLPGETQSVTTKQLKGFLEDPVKSGFQRHLSIYAETADVEEISMVEDEPFSTEFPFDYRIRTRSIAIWLDEYFSGGCENIKAERLAEICDHLYENYRIMSLTPDGIYANLEKADLIAEIARTAEPISQLHPRIASARQHFGRLICGDPAQLLTAADVPLLQVPAARFALEGENKDGSDQLRQVAVHGGLSWIWQESQGDWHTLVLSGARGSHLRPDKYILEPALTYLAVQATGEGAERFCGRSFTCHLVYREKMGDWTMRVDPKCDGDYLRRLLEEYLEPSIPGWLPFENATRLSVKPHLDSEAAPIEEQHRFVSELQDKFTDSEDTILQLAKPVFGIELYTVARKRFAVFFKRSRDSKGQG